MDAHWAKEYRELYRCTCDNIIVDLENEVFRRVTIDSCKAAPIFQKCICGFGEEDGCRALTHNCVCKYLDSCKAPFGKHVCICNSSVSRLCKATSSNHPCVCLSKSSGECLAKYSTHMCICPNASCKSRVHLESR